MLKVFILLPHFSLALLCILLWLVKLVQSFTLLLLDPISRALPTGGMGVEQEQSQLPFSQKTQIQIMMLLNTVQKTARKVVQKVSWRKSPSKHILRLERKVCLRKYITREIVCDLEVLGEKLVMCLLISED
jgi:hypothetical protein